jgi:DNA-3-methyladenine glycosylase II
MAKATVQIKGPYSLETSLAARAAYGEDVAVKPSTTLPVRVDGRPTVLKVNQPAARPQTLIAEADESVPEYKLGAVARWIFHTELDLSAFYALVADDPVLGPITERLHGLKPLRPASLFEMAVIAVTEQQISMTAARKIRGRIVETYGELKNGLHFFPLPESLAAASVEDLKARGLSTRKAEYIRNLAQQVENGDLDLEALKDRPNDEVIERLTQLRGFGRWSADYLLIRGLGRLDVVVADDLGVRKVVGGYFKEGGQPMTAAEVREALAPYSPYRGLAMFYLLTAPRL